MNLARALQIFVFLTFTVITLNGVIWLLNAPNDGLLMLAGLVVILYLWLAVKTNAFTNNPFKSKSHE